MPIIRIKRGTTTQWTNSTSPLSSGELGYDTTSKVIKIGDGTTLWNSLLPLNKFEIDEISQDAIYSALTNFVSTGNNITVEYNDEGNYIVLDVGPDVVLQSDLVQAVLDQIGQLTTDSLEEGTVNVYWTESRTKEAAAELLVNSTQSNISITGNGAGLTISAQGGLAGSTTDNLTEGTTNFYFTNQRALDATALAYDVIGSASTAESNAIAESNEYTDIAIAGLGNQIGEDYIPISLLGNIDGVAQLDSNGLVPDNQIPSTIARDSELFSGSYNDLTDKPAIALGAVQWTANHYQLPGGANTRYLAGDIVWDGGNIYVANFDNESLPTTNTQYWSLVGPGNRLNIDGRDIPNILWDNILQKPTFFNGDYDNLYNTPTLFSGSYNDLTEKPALFDGSYLSLTNTPTLFSGSYNDLTDQPTLFSGSYNDLSDKPTIPSLTGYATETYVNTSVSNLVDSAPETLNTLNELAAALGDDPNYATTISTALGNKLDSTTAASTYLTQTNASSTYATQTALDLKLSLTDPSIDYYITNSGSGSYTVNGVANGPVEFIKGKKYRIHINASGHPFWIQTVLGAYSAGNVYSTGITGNGTQVGHIIVELPQNAPDNLYYVCQFHSSMSGVVLVRTDNVSFNAQSSNYTVTTSDSGRLIEMSGGGTLTISDSSSFPVGFTCDILQTGSSQVTVVGNGFTPNGTPGLKLRAQWSSATLVKRALNSWIIMGDLSA